MPRQLRSSDKDSSYNLDPAITYTHRELLSLTGLYKCNWSQNLAIFIFHICPQLLPVTLGKPGLKQKWKFLLSYKNANLATWLDVTV